MRPAEDPEVIEGMLETLLDDLEENQDQYSPWEQQFLESIEDQLDSSVLTDKQVEKLQEIYSDRGW